MNTYEVITKLTDRDGLLVSFEIEADKYIFTAVGSPIVFYAEDPETNELDPVAIVFEDLIVAIVRKAASSDE